MIPSKQKPACWHSNLLRSCWSVHSLLGDSTKGLIPADSRSDYLVVAMVEVAATQADRADIERRAAELQLAAAGHKA